MDSFYPALRNLHIAAALTSGALFLVRGVALNMMGLGWPMRPAVRRVSYIVDTVLLGAAIALLFAIGQYPFVNDWLTAKVLLVALYIVLGSFALKRGRTEAVRNACFLLALAVFAFIITVARTHHPLGAFSGAL